MFGRRGYQRFDVGGTVQGVLQVVRDVVVQSAGEGDWCVLGREPGVVGELLTLEGGEADRPQRQKVRVTGSRPVLVNGAVRHQLQLEACEALS